MSALTRRHSSQLSDILYELVTCSLGGKSVKCVVNEDEHIFTSDMEVLLSNLHTEHPEVELIIQALKSHKAQHGEGIRCFLFMVTRIAKAVKQLEHLGIAHNVSTSVMQEAINQLTNEVREISVPVVTSTPYNTSREELSLEHTLKRSESVFLEPLQYEHKMTRVEEYNVRANVTSLTIGPPFENEDMKQYQVDPKQNSRKMSPQIYVDNSNMNNCVDEAGPARTHCEFQRLVENKSFPTERFTDVMETNIVHLKMVNLSETEHELDVNDIDWLFDKTSKDYSGSKNSIENDSNGLEDVVTDCVMGKHSTESGIYKKSSRNLKPKNDSNHETPLSSLCDNDKHDSDFEDCFDDVDSKKHVTVVESMTRKSSESQTQKDDGSLMGMLCKNLLVKNEFDEPNDLSYSFLKSDVQNTDEFDNCFDTQSQGFIKESQEKINEEKIQSEKHPLRSSAKFDSAQTDEPKTLFLQTQNNIHEKKECSLSKDSFLLPEVAQLNSVLKQIGGHKTHNTQQVVMSIRNDLKEEVVLDDHRKEESMKFPHGKDCHPNFNKIEKDLDKKDAIKCVNDNKSDEVNPNELLANGNDKSELLKVDALLKNLNAQNHPMRMARVMASSRYMNQREDIQQSKQTNPQNVTIPKNEITSVHNSTTDPDHQMNSHTIRISEIDGFGHSLINVHTENSDVLNNDCHKNPTSDLHEVEVRNEHKLHPEPNALIKQEMRLPENVCHLSRGSHDLMELVRQVYCLQVKDGSIDRQQGSFNFNKFHCVSSQSSNCSRKVVKGLVIACSNQVLEMIGRSSSRNTLLVNGDLKPSFVHKGYKSVVERKAIVETSLNSSHVGKDQKWALKALDVIKRLNIGSLIVRGTISSILSDMLSTEDVLVLSNVPFRAMEIISHVHKIHMVSYIQDLEEVNVCHLHYQPLDECWMDKEENSHCLIISNMPNTQTVVFELPSLMSCQIEEEKIWKCFYRMSNALRDGCVLPGHGATEAWCQTQLRLKAEKWSGTSSSTIHLQKALIIQALSDVFHDYVSVVRLNTGTVNGHDWNQQLFSTFPWCKAAANCNAIQKCLTELTSKDNKFQQVIASKGSFRDEKDLEFSGFDAENDKELMESSENVRQGHLKEGNLPNQNDGYETTLHYDTFSSKVSAWSSALDWVQVLFSLDSLIITGVSSSDLTTGEIML